ncbi:MAG TPA: toll/interleukin-1 receptor domain-containing protein [Pyrinomonadaceae bacterium]|nr:toll/interleukin-1 receptor domain-containing protein [Pyrinomonadaceae bacterium]
MRLFLSYSSRDSAFADSLSKKLRERGVDTWTNQEERMWGTNLFDLTGEALNKASAVAFLMSEHSRNSQWVAFEVGAASAQGKPIFPILLSHNESIIPPHLKHLNFLNAKNLSLEQLADIIKDKMRNIPT